MRDQDTFNFGASHELYDSYEQLNSPVLSQETLDTLNTPAPKPDNVVNMMEQRNSSDIEHEAAVHVLGLGYSLKSMRDSKLSGDNS